jgi:perosamine synthetase
MKPFIPVSAPALTGNEKRYVMECLETTWISSIGSFIDRFERAFAEYCGAEYAVSCCNGTVALHLCLLGLEIGPGDEVLVPSLTYVASANAVRYCGAEPVFVDSDRQTWNIDPADVRRKLGPRVKAILPVHLYGKPAAMDELTRIGEEHGLRIVEDAAEATGARLNGRMVGALAEVAAFSFFGNKIITCGEGGMIVTDDHDLAQRIRQLKGQGQDPERRYWFPVVGYNYRMTNIQAAIGLAQLERIADHLAARDEIESWYREELRSHPGITLPAREPAERGVNWLFSIVLKDCARGQRDAVMARLHERGVDSRPFFYPCHVLPPYQHRSHDCTNAEWLSARGLSLPTWVGLRRADVKRIASELLAAVDLASAGLASESE